MTDATARLALPFIAPGQAQKELFHNEALIRIDAALHPIAQSLGDNDPPAAPAIGQCWIVGPVPTGAWAGQAQALAAWTEGGWRFVAPVPGMAVWLPGDGVYARYDPAGWRRGEVPANALIVGGVQVVGTRQPSVAVPTGGAVIDVEARAGIAAILAALSAHGLLSA